MAEEKVVKKEEVKKVINATVETYAEDMARVLESNENGIAGKIIEEDEIKNLEKKNMTLDGSLNKIFLSVGILLVVLAVVAICLVYFLRKDIFTVEVAPQYVPIVFTDKSEFKEISGLKKEEVIQTIINESNTAEFKEGGIEGIYLSVNKKVLGFRQFLDIIEANLGQTKIEFFNDNFLIGATDKKNTINNQTNRNVFILLKMRSITDVFDPMKVWESKMFYDLHSLFGMDLNESSKYLLEKNFEDGIIQNKNARILRDRNEHIVLMYIYAEDDSLIITNSESAVAEVILRLASSQIKK